MKLFDKEKVTKLTDKALYESKKIVKAASEKAVEAIEEKQKKKIFEGIKPIDSKELKTKSRRLKNVYMFTSIKNFRGCKRSIVSITSEAYYTSNIIQLGRPNPTFKLVPKRIIEQGYANKAIPKYLFSNDYAVTFEREPTNKYDKNAIKVLFNNVQVGYIPMHIQKEFNDLLEKNIVGVNSFIERGPYKFLYMDEQSQVIDDCSDLKQDFNIKLHIFIK